MEKKLLLLINDLKVFYIISKKLKQKGIRWKVLELEKKGSLIPYSESIIVSDKDTITYIKKNGISEDILHYYSFINYLDYPNFDILLINIIKEMWGIKLFQTLLFSIDPGENHIGIAYFLDRKLLLTEELYDDIQIISKINLFYFSLKPKNVEIKIGSGNLHLLRRVLPLLMGYDQDNLIEPNFILYLVDEFKSSKSSKYKYYYKNYQRIRSIPRKKMSIHEISAITIGIREGTVIKQDEMERIINKEANQSELKHIQNLSRKKSIGRYSLSKSLAKDVYDGKITLENALKIHKKRIENNKNEP